MIEDVWKKYNVSTIMVLPLFHDITKDIYAKGTTLRFPFVQLAFEYGLINTFLFKNNTEIRDLHLLFDRKTVTSDLKLTSSPYYCFADVLIDSGYYVNIEQVNEEQVMISLTIPEKYIKDITHILESKYSKLSIEYKREIKVEGTLDKEGIIRVPVTDNELGNYIVTRDLGYAIAIKAKHIRDEVENALEVSLADSEEFYTKFDETKELLKI